MDAVLAPAQVAAATVTVRQTAVGWPAGPRIDQVVQLLSASLPATPHDARRRQATAVDDDSRTRSVGGRVVLVGQPHDPAAERRAGHRDVAAEADEHAGASSERPRPPRRGRRTRPWPSLPGRARPLPARRPSSARGRRGPLANRACSSRPQPAAGPRGDELEVTVVAEHLEHAPDRRIDEAVRRGRRAERHVDGVEQGVRCEPRGGRRRGSPPRARCRHGTCCRRGRRPRSRPPPPRWRPPGPPPQ